MIFKPNKYGYYLTVLDEADLAVQDANDYIENSNFFDEPTNQSGWSGLKDRITNVVITVKNKAAKALGLKDGFTIRGCINKLGDLLSSLISKARDTIKTWTPAIRNFIDKLCNYIQDAIDYIKSELE